MPYEDYPIFTDPPESNKLWRYISLAKFESILRKSALFFCRADKFSDPFEGSSPDKEVEHRIEDERIIMKQMGKKFDPNQAVKQAEMLSKFQRKLSSLVIINCWHFNTHESDAMWQLYLKDNEGIAIQTTSKKLQKCFAPTDYTVNAGKVRYLDYQNDIYYDQDQFQNVAYNVKTPFIHKRNHFKHEQEYRALIEVETENGWEYDWGAEEYTKGKMIQIDVETLIEKIIVPPNTNEKFANEVKKLISMYGYDFHVRKSEMEKEPKF